MPVKSKNIFLPIFCLCCLIFFIGIILWKKICCYRRLVIPYDNPRVAVITQTYQQQQPYQTAWPPRFEEPPPSYYAAMNTAIIPPSMSYVKQ